MLYSFHLAAPGATPGQTLASHTERYRVIPMVRLPPTHYSQRVFPNPLPALNGAQRGIPRPNNAPYRGAVTRCGSKVSTVFGGPAPGPTPGAILVTRGWSRGCENIFYVVTSTTVSPTRTMVLIPRSAIWRAAIWISVHHGSLVQRSSAQTKYRTGSALGM